MHSFLSFALCLGAARLVRPSIVAEHQNARRQDGPVPPDTVKDCTYFYDSQPGDTCASIADNWGITSAQFKTYNPSVKADCSGLIIGDAYCVEENYGNGPAPETTSSTTLRQPRPQLHRHQLDPRQCKAASPLNVKGHESSLDFAVADRSRPTILQGPRRRYLCWHRRQVSHLHLAKFVRTPDTVDKP